MTPTPSDPLIGRTIAQYEIVAKLGGGGMGVVYKALDTKLGRTVALKFLPPQWSHDENAKQRFLREAQAASATNHRNICVVHDIGETDDGQLFIVMAYYEGQTLKQRLDAGPLPVVEAVEIATEAAEGLAKAHALGVVHRDIKPGNLIITDDGVKVLDFGLAKFADSVQLTLEGSTVGTAAYMSPEQVRSEEADARSDVWALGVVMYEMLTGGVPFKGSYAEAIFHAIKHEPAPPLVRADGEIPDVLERIVLRALDKDPAARFQGARELARALRMLQGRTVPLELRTEALPDMAGARLPGRPGARRRVTVWRAVAAVTVLAAAGAGAYRYATRPVARIPVAIAPVANETGYAELDAYRLGLTRSLIDDLARSPNIRVVPYPRLYEMVGRFASGSGDVSSREALQAISTASGADVVVIPTLTYRSGGWLARAEFRNVATGTSVGAFETDAVTSSLPKETANRLMASLAAGIEPHFKTGWLWRAFAPLPTTSRFRTLEAARYFEEGLRDYESLEDAAALDALQRSVVEDDQHALTHAWVSRLFLLLSRGNEAAAAAQRAKQLVSADTLRADAAFVDAVLSEGVGDLPTAKTRYERLAALAMDDPSARIELADFLKRQNSNEEAIQAYRDGLRFDPGYVRPHVDLCQLYTRIDDQPLAEKEANAALDSYRRAGDRAGEAQALLCLGEAERVQSGKRLVDAQAHIEAARVILESLGYAYGLSRVYQYLGNVASSGRDYTAAVRFFDSALTRGRQVGNRRIEGVALMNLGVIDERLGQRVKALDYFQRSRAVYEDIGDQRSAAEQEVNAASLRVNYGNDPATALAQVANAEATLHRLGYVNFELLAMQVRAEGELHAGRQDEARRQLREALSVATARQLGNRVAWLNLNLALSELRAGEYEGARVRLEQIAASDAGRDDLEVQIAIGRAYVGLGAFDTARARLGKALAGAEGSGQLKLVPAAHEALGEMAYDAGSLQDARSHFAEAESFWKEGLPDPASVEARCYRALLDATSGRNAEDGARAGVEQARLMGHLNLEATCRVHQARINVMTKHYDKALAVLNEIPLAGDRAVGRELQALVHFGRSQALAERGDSAAATSEAAIAAQQVDQLRAALPASSREGFASRRDIRQVIRQSAVH